MNISECLNDEKEPLNGFNIKKLKNFLEKGGSANSFSHLQNTEISALNIALLSKNKAAVELLLNYGANPNLHQGATNASLLLCAKENLTGFSELLIKHGAKLEVDPTGELTPIHMAARYDNDAFLKEILTKENVDILDIDQESALSLAVNFNSIKTARMLLEHGANTEIKSRKTGTPIHNACLYADLPMVELLLEYGADPHSKDNYEETALHYVSSSDLETLPTFKKQKAMEEAATKIAKTLLTMGLDPFQKRKDGKTAMDLAKEFEHEGIVKAFTEYKRREIAKRVKDKLGDIEI